MPLASHLVDNKQVMTSNYHYFSTRLLFELNNLLYLIFCKTKANILIMLIEITGAVNVPARYNKTMHSYIVYTVVNQK